MVVIGLTGGIACGKSAVSSRLQGYGVVVVDADQVARDVVLPGSAGLAAVVDAFGASVLLPDGALDRKSLGARVFGDDAARARLNAILHPRIAAESAARFASLSGQGHGFVVYDAALLIENGIHRAMEAVVVVTAQPAVQRARLMARDGLTLAEADARIAAQWPLAKKVAEAHHVIDNSGDREALDARVREVYALLVTRYGAPRRAALGGSAP